MINQHYYRMNSNFINCLRWIFVIPCAILGAFVGQALAMFIGYIVPWFADWFIHILGSYFIGISFVFLGTFLAPKNKVNISNILFLICLIVSICGLVYAYSTNFEYNKWLLFLNAFVLLIGAYEVTKMIIILERDKSIY